MYILQTKANTHPSKCAFVWVCVSAYIQPNLYLSLLSTARAFRVRKQTKLHLLSMSWESGFAQQAAPGGRGERDWTLVVCPLPPPIPQKWRQHGHYSILRAVENQTLKNVQSGWQQVDFFSFSSFRCRNKNTDEWLGLSRPFSAALGNMKTRSSAGISFMWRNRGDF